MKKPILLTNDKTEAKFARKKVLANLVEGTRAPRRGPARQTPKVDRNLLKKLPENNLELKHALFECFMMARRGKTRTVDEYNFEIFAEENLELLYQDIVKRRWKPSASKAFITHTPVIREIFAAPFRDRIVHHLLYAVVAPWWDKRFIYDSYSCRRGKGTDFGILRMQKFMRSASRNGTQKAYVLKGDLSGYFMSLNRETLYEKVMWGLSRQFPEKGWLYELCEFLWKEVIFDNPCANAKIAGSKSDWEHLPKNKSLFHQKSGYGIVIGNLTSQLLSNIMLNDFDWWMRRRFSYYGRYVDDFFIVVEERDYQMAKSMMRREIPEKLAAMGLKMHPKKLYIQEVKHGCPFLGKMVRPFVLTPGTRYQRNMKKAFLGYMDGRVNYETAQSYAGMGTQMASYTAMKKVLDQR